MLDIKSYLLGKKASGGSSSGGNTGEETVRGEMEIMDDWATIKAHSDNGTAESVYKLGDYKWVTWNYEYSPYTEMTMKFVIVGFNCTPDENGVKKGITFMQMGWFPSYSETGTTELWKNFKNSGPEELRQCLGKSTISTWNKTTGGMEISNNALTFLPDASNFKENFIGEYGSSFDLYKGTDNSSLLKSGVQYHYTDDSCFPYFAGKSYAEICSLIGVRRTSSIVTRSGVAYTYTVSGTSATVYSFLLKVGFSNFELNNKAIYGPSVSVAPICFRI